MSRLTNRRKEAQNTLVDFAHWVEIGMEVSFHNVLVLKRLNPVGLRNPVLLFAVPRAMNQIPERYAIEVVQGWELLNRELKDQGLRTLGVSDKHFRHLKRVRNKLVAHKIENWVNTKRHANWYKKAYGSYEAVFELIRKVATRVRDKVRWLESQVDCLQRQLRHARRAASKRKTFSNCSRP